MLWFVFPEKSMKYIEPKKILDLFAQVNTFTVFIGIFT